MPVVFTEVVKGRNRSGVRIENSVLGIFIMDIQVEMPSEQGVYTFGV